jgi:hypothetical protein
MAVGLVRSVGDYGKEGVGQGGFTGLLGVVTDAATGS